MGCIRTGLSYTNFSYSKLAAPSTIAPCDGLNITVLVSNTGAVAAAETVQAYIQWQSPSVPAYPHPQMGLKCVLLLAALADI